MTPNFTIRGACCWGGGAKTEQSKEAGSKACPGKSRPDDAGMRRFAASSVQQSDFVVLDKRVGEQLLAHLADLGRVLHLELHEPPDAYVRGAAEAECRECALDRLALRVEDALLRPNQHPGSGHLRLPPRCASARPRTARR